jgi:hypothetical protein
MSIRNVNHIAEALARNTDTRRSFIGRLGKAIFVVAAGVAAGIPLSNVAEAGGCSFPYGVCSGSHQCPEFGGCPSGCSPDPTYHSPGNCWWSGANECCDCYCGGSRCGCRSWGLAA